jgi:hypothetical protein
MPRGTLRTTRSERGYPEQCLVGLAGPDVPPVIDLANELMQGRGQVGEHVLERAA